MNTIHKITPFLWFDHQAVEAARFYVSLFENARILEDETNDSTESIQPDPLEDAQSVSFELDGQSFIAFNGGPYFKFTPAISMYVDCEDQAEVDRLWDALIQGGEPSQCGWLTDRFGLTWQIVPRILHEALNHPDPIKAQKAMDAMLKMVKLEAAVFEEICK